MGYDNRFPHMLPLERPIPGVADADRRAMRRAADAVCRRTGARCVFNIRRRSLHFYWGEMDSGVLNAPVFRESGVLTGVSTHDVDLMVQYIQLGTLPRQVKDRWAESRRKMEEHDRSEAIEREIEERRPDALDHASYLRQKRGMGSKWRKGAVVQGLGGTK